MTAESRVTSEAEGLQSCVIEGRVSHARRRPKRHAFVYPTFYVAVDIDELDVLDEQLGIYFSRNRLSFFSLYDADYLSCYAGGLREKLRQCKDLGDSELASCRVLLVTHPRCLGFVFNPVSFFLLYRQKTNAVGQLSPEYEVCAVVAEVHNTFSERHLYVLGSDSRLVPEGADSKTTAVFETSKDFHVSPFFSRDGVYRFEISLTHDFLRVGVHLRQDGELVFSSTVEGKRRSCKVATFREVMLRYPGAIFLTSIRIVMQAAVLKFRKGLRVFTKPIASSAATFQAQGPGVLQRVSRKSVHSFLSKISRGRLTFVYPNGAQEVFRGKAEGVEAVIQVHNYDLFTRSFFSGDIGFGESHVEGDWDSIELVDVLRLFCQNLDTLNDRGMFFSYLGRAWNAIMHYTRPNSVANSTHNIRRHYDLSNELFQLFLDDRMQYSSGVFDENCQTLASAQSNKIERIIKQAQITAEDYVLEIGCGWGGLACEIASKTGARVKGVTLSLEQAKYAQQMVAEKGLDDLVEIVVCDYRKLDGQYSKIVSVEMIEAVGHRYLGEFFAV